MILYIYVYMHFPQLLITHFFIEAIEVKVIVTKLYSF